MSASQSLTAYVIFLGTAVVGFVGAAWWVKAATVLLLTAVNHDEHLRLARRFSRLGERRTPDVSVFQSYAWQHRRRD